MDEQMNKSGFVIGVDAGGTASRAIAMNADGEILGRGNSGGANPTSLPVEVAAEHIAEAISGALSGMEPQETHACVVGMAGVMLLNDPVKKKAFNQVLTNLKLGCPIRVIDDAEVAFSSATREQNGTALIAGTGSITIEILNRQVTSIAGGGGWLLGDEGSAFWLGREVIRTTLTALREEQEIAGLPKALLTEVIGTSNFDYSTKAARVNLRQDLIGFVYKEDPIQLARFAPLVSKYAEENDPIAIGIVEQAVELLTKNVLSVRKASDNGPVVLIGSVIAQGAPVGIKLRQRLSTLDILESPGGEFGAAWLAAIEVYGEQVPHPTELR